MPNSFDALLPQSTITKEIGFKCLRHDYTTNSCNDDLAAGYLLILSVKQISINRLMEDVAFYVLNYKHYYQFRQAFWLGGSLLLIAGVRHNCCVPYVQKMHTTTSYLTCCG